ncbi:hypothetical protein AB3X52_13395 [Nocardioides sp. DS6]|uniref:Uncharacterized protein n=1 Tax=Nocardioides eburneus TaxID=3231482 RepID=A0ABV3T2Z9_9ACTN
MSMPQTLLPVHLTNTYPEVLDLLNDPDEALRHLQEWTVGNWRRVGRDNADQVTHVGGVYKNRFVSLYEINGYVIDAEGRYRFQEPTPAEDRYHTLIGETFRWRRGYSGGWMPPRPLRLGKPYPPSARETTTVDAMLACAQEMASRRTLGMDDAVPVDQTDPLLSSVTVTRNPRGGIIIEVPSGTNVLIKQV